MNNANMLLSRGNSLKAIGKALLLAGVAAVCILLITLFFCGKYASRYLALSGAYEIVNFLVGICYSLTGLGSMGFFLYLFGLVLIGLGQIAYNTCPPAEEQPAAPAAENHPATPSAALINGLKSALETDTDDTLLARLKEVHHRLTRQNEKQLVQVLLDAPASRKRTLSNQVYEALLKKTQK